MFGIGTRHAVMGHVFATTSRSTVRCPIYLWKTAARLLVCLRQCLWHAGPVRRERRAVCRFVCCDVVCLCIALQKVVVGTMFSRDKHCCQIESDHMVGCAVWQCAVKNSCRVDPQAAFHSPLPCSCLQLLLDASCACVLLTFSLVVWQHSCSHSLWSKHNSGSIH